LSRGASGLETPLLTVRAAVFLAVADKSTSEDLPMRTLIILFLATLSVGCSSRSALDRHLDAAYQHYQAGDCDNVMLELSQAERRSRPHDNVQPEISLLRGQCLERQGLFVDAAQTYRFIQTRYPASEYAFRGHARLETLRQLGHYQPEERVVTHAVTLKRSR